MCDPTRPAYPPTVCLVLAVALLFGAGCTQTPARPGKSAAVESDAFQAMDDGMMLSPAESRGRRDWLLWCGGSEAFWDHLARNSDGLVDLLLTIDSRRRPHRFEEMGLINEPGYRAAAKPDAFGLWIDESSAPERGTIDPELYGRSTGIMGFRLFPNPDFRDEAVQRWDAERYYRDRSYARSPNLIRPYRVGISCASCHVAFNPCRPPADPENPAWENLVSALGNQYLREGRVFAAPLARDSFVGQMLEAQPPGTSDTSRIATDHLNNPGAINGLFALAARLQAPADETLAGETLLLPGTATHSRVPLALKDGADSAGLAAAMLRVYVNIGVDSADWLERHDALLGRRPQEPFSIATAQQNSAAWRATVQRIPDELAFLLRLQPYRLANAPGGDRYLTKDAGTLTRGGRVFAEACAGCHSSKRPPAGVNAKAWFREQVLRPDFAEGNAFSDGRRHSVVEIGTNAVRCFATNARRGHIWAAFSSETYKTLPSPGALRVWNPFTNDEDVLAVPAGGTGYYRTPPLAGLWSTAPFLHHNALGRYTGDPSVAGRMAAFDDAVEKLLWPEKRLGRASLWRTTAPCDIAIPASLLPSAMASTLAAECDRDGVLRLGPLPAGLPVDLIANLDLSAEPELLVAAIVALKHACADAAQRGLTGDAAVQAIGVQAGAALLRVNGCPDFIQDHGHTFGATLPDADKRALIAYLKTL